MEERRSGRDRRSGKDRRSGQDRRDPNRSESQWEGENDRRSGVGRRVRNRRSGVDRRGYSPFAITPEKTSAIPLTDERPRRVSRKRARP